MLRDASLYSGVVALALLLLFVIAAVSAGRNRNANAFIFPKLIPFSSLILSGLVLVQGLILTYAAYVGESHAIGRVHFFLIGLIGLGAVLGAVTLIRATTTFKADLTQNEMAQQITGDDSPKLWKFVRDIASEVGGKPPDNIIVGLDPTFYATAAKVNLVGRDVVLRGETLYLSTSLMRLLNIDELRAVIGHELGHFKGEDTVYSLKFAPVYAGLGHAIATLNDDDAGATVIAKLPAIVMLSFMYDLFSINENRISRDREFEADQAGISVASKEALATSLGKVAVYSQLWAGIRENNIVRLNEGKISRNLGKVFEDSALFDVSARHIDEILDLILGTRIAHPTDSHPPIAARYDKIGFDPENLTGQVLTQVGSSLPAVIDEPDSIEEELTSFEHQMMIGLGYAALPEDEEGEQTAFLNAVYSLAATMVGADGKIEQSEIVEAEQIGSTLFEKFDSVEFRSYCNILNEIPKFEEVTSILSSALNAEQKNGLYDYLKAIASADGEVSEEEKSLLLHMRTEWKLEI